MSVVDPSLEARPLRSGVVVALPLRADRTLLYDLCAALADRAEEFAAGERDVIAAFGFASERGETGLAISHIGAQATASRPDIAVVLGFPVVDAIRVDSFTSAQAPAAALRAETLLLRNARDIARTYAGLVCDDLGAIYEAAELDDRVTRGLPRETMFAFAVAASARIETIRDSSLSAAIASHDLSGERAPSECAPDIALTTASIFVVMGPHVPLITATRIAFVSAKARSIPVVVFGPNLLASDEAVLRSAGIDLARSISDIDALLAHDDNASPRQSIVAHNMYGRDEVSSFTAGLGHDAARAFVERRIFEVAEMSGRGFVDQPKVAIEESERPNQCTATRLAHFAFSGTLLELYHLDLARAHPLLLALVGARGELRDLFGREITNAIVCEFLAFEESPNDVADAFAMSLLAELSAREPSIAQDDSGAIFDAEQLAGLSVRRRGRAESWNERVTVAGLFGSA